MKQVSNYILVVIMLSLAACSPKYYVPNTQNVPLLQAKGQTNLSLAGSGNQFEIQGAHGVSDNIGVMFNGGYFTGSGEEENGKGSGVLGEIGVGYFTPIGEHFTFETYGLAGIGSVENIFTPVSGNSNSGTLKAGIARFGLQPNIGFSSRFFTVALSTRLISLHYSGIEGDLVYGGENQVDYLTANSPGFLIEPALTIRAGLENAKLQLQFCRSFNLSNKDFFQEASVITLGLNFNLYGAR